MASRYFAVAGVNIVTLKMNRTLSSAMVMTFADIRIMIAEVSTSIQLVAVGSRSEEHTSELQSRFELVCRLLLEKNNERKGQCVRGEVGVRKLSKRSSPDNTTARCERNSERDK